MLQPKKYVNQSVPKRDAKALTTGQPVYTDDLAPDNCLIVKLLRSPHASAKITSIDTPRAFFAENNFYTTAVNRMTRGYYDGVVTVPELAELCRKNGEAHS